LLETRPVSVAYDLHPEYFSTKWARSSGLKQVPVQHHYAHIMSCMAENEIVAPALGIAWDGTGYGTDGTIWGGEFLRMKKGGFDRVAHLHTFPLPGGDAAIREPRRSALGLLYSIYGANACELDGLDAVKTFSSTELAVVCEMLSRGINSPLTSSAGRLFDAVASLIGLRQRTGFEGQAAMELEFIADRSVAGSYPFSVDQTNSTAVIDPAETVRAILRDHEEGVPCSAIASRFHNTMAEIMVAVAKIAGEEKIALSGGCFQNKLLTELAVTRLRSEGFKVYWHQRIPPNDGGIALGQLAALAAQE
jgi:hydrogenase maturation protein HypF